ncbi:MAG TPA: hypothetical protein VGM26_13625 [Rhizomicrobium sp.]
MTDAIPNHPGARDYVLQRTTFIMNRCQSIVEAFAADQPPLQAMCALQMAAQTFDGCAHVSGRQNGEKQFGAGGAGNAPKNRVHDRTYRELA